MGQEKKLGRNTSILSQSPPRALNQSRASQGSLKDTVKGKNKNIKFVYNSEILSPPTNRNKKYNPSFNSKKGSIQTAMATAEQFISSAGNAKQSKKKNEKYGSVAEFTTSDFKRGSISKKSPSRYASTQKKDKEN